MVLYRVNSEDKDYETALDYLKMTTLKKIREILTSKFAIDTAEMKDMKVSLNQNLP